MNSNYKSFFEFACCWLKQKGESTCRSIATLAVLFSLFATQSSANDIANHAFLGWQNLSDYSNETIAGNVQNSVLNFGTFNTCPKPSNGTATIDGIYSEWDLTKDFFADMYRAGDTQKQVESKLYVRYDCKTEKLCVLVKTVDGVVALQQNADAFIKILGKKVVDGNYGRTYFRWIYKNRMAVGFEACGKVAPGQYTDLNVHLQVMDMESQTSAVADRMIPICLDECACELEIECPKKWQGGDKPCDFVAPGFETLKDFYALGGKVISYCDDVFVKSYSSEGGACAGWLKKMMTLSDGENEHTCVVQWDFKKDDLVIRCPRPVEMECKTQREVDEKFKWWLNEYKVEGACDGYRVITDPRDPKAPDACEGGYVKVKFIVIDGCGRKKACESSFKVHKPEPVDAWAPQDLTLEYCLSQKEVDEKFHLWLKRFGARGGCDLQYNIYVVEGEGDYQKPGEKPVAPNNCGGYVKVKISAYDNICLKMEDEDYAVFTVKKAPELKLIYPENKWLDYCLSQEEVNKEFKAWLMSFSAEGGCATVYSDLWGYDPPRACGGKVEVEFWAYDKCGQREGIKRTFGVKRAPKLEYKCPPDLRIKACTNQDEVNKYFRKWLTGFMVSGGCSPRYPDVWKYKAPPACGGKVEIPFWITDRCSKEVGCNVTFIVERAPKLEVNCPKNFIMRACASQDEVDMAFKRWLNTFKVEGGCYPSAKFNQYEHPKACGSKTEVIFYAGDKCQQKAKCMAYFIVAEPDELKAVCPPTGKAEACLTQSEVDELFKTWLQGFKPEGGCNAKGKFLPYLEPKACGDKVEVTYYVYDECKKEAKCSAYFYVARPDELKAICPPAYTMPACATQDEIDQTFKRWINFFRTEGGCEAISTPLDKYEAPKLCGGVVKIKFETRDRCGMYDYCETYFKVDKREKVQVYCPEDHTADADQTPAEVAAEWEAWLDKFGAKGPCKPLAVKYYLNGKEVASLADLKKLVPDACGSDDQTVKIVAYDDCSKDYCEAVFDVEESFQRLILSLPDDQKLCHLGKYAPTKEDLPPPLTKEEVLLALKVPNCIQPVIPTFTIMVMGPEVTGDIYKFTRVYKVKAGPLSTESAEIIKLVWDREGPVFKGIPGTQIIPCGSEPPAWPAVTAEDSHGRSIKITRKQEKSFILCGGTYWIRTWIASDECGNVARRSQKIYYQDEGPPVLEVPDDITIYCPGQIPEPTYEAYDDCSDVKVEFEEKRSDQNSCEYTITRTWTAYDGCGRKTVESQVITVIDHEAPIITPTNPMLVDMPIGGEMITYNCDAPAITMGDVEVYDECCSDFVVETKDELIANATCDVFGYYRKWKCSVTATDDAGNSSEYYFYVLQYDTTAPEILNVPEDLVLGCEDIIPAAATDVEVSDNCSLEKVPEYREEVFFDPQDSSKYGIVRTWYSTDHCGNYGEDYQIIAKCGFDVSLIEAKLGNSVWLDENGNGLQETEEPGIDGVTIYLHQVRVVGGETKTTKIDSTVTTTIDGNAGQYEFDQLVRGTYQLQFSQPDGMEFTIPFAGVDATNSDVDPRTGFTEEIDLGFGQKRMEFDAGFLKGPLYDAAPLGDFNFEANEPVVEIDDISVFPNPTTALINVAMDIPEDGRVQLNIIDQLGQIVLSQTRNLNRGKQTETIDLHAIPAGTYMLNVKMSDRSVTKMIIRN